jgi:phosphohistidine phosphatase SixA
MTVGAVGVSLGGVDEVEMGAELPSPVHPTAAMPAKRSAIQRRRVLTDAASYANPERKDAAVVRQLEVRRHAERNPEEDKLSARGRTQARTLGEASEGVHYDVVYVSPAQRAAETAAWFLRGAGHGLPDHEVVPGLAGRDESGGTPEGMADGLRSLVGRIPDGGRGIAFSHTPFIERAALVLTGREIEPLRECEGILVTRHDDGTITVDELRLSAPA